MDNMIGMSQYPNKWFDLAVVDPPYGIGEDGGKHHRNYKKDGSIRPIKDFRTGRETMTKCRKWDAKEWDKKQPEQKYFNELIRVSKRQIIWGSNYILFEQKGNSTGRLFWDKVNGGSDFSDGELAWVNFYTGIKQFTFMWSGMLQGKSIEEGHLFIGDISKKETRIHPTQKPVALYDWIYKNYAKPGMKILDTHVGSGSSRIAAYKAGLDFIGYELDADYWQAQEDRYRAFVMNTAPADIEPIAANGQIKLF